MSASCPSKALVSERWLLVVSQRLSPVPFGLSQGCLKFFKSLFLVPSGSEDLLPITIEDGATEASRRKTLSMCFPVSLPTDVLCARQAGRQWLCTVSFFSLCDPLTCFLALWRRAYASLHVCSVNKGNMYQVRLPPWRCLPPCNFFNPYYLSEYLLLSKSQWTKKHIQFHLGVIAAVVAWQYWKPFYLSTKPNQWQRERVC